MDIQHTLNKPNKKNALRSLGARWMVGALLLGAIIALYFINSSEDKISKESIRTATIEQGDFTIRVTGYGKLKVKHQRILTSPSQAIVDKILHYPGTQVSADTVILHLSDPLLAQARIEAKLELARQQAGLKEQTIAHKSALLERDAQIEILQSELENAELRAEAEASLIDKGIVSALDYKATQLTLRQLKRRLEIEFSRRSQLQDMQQARLSITKDLVTQYEWNFQSINTRFEQLKVKAGINGVIQTMSAQIGLSVSMGTQMAVIGSHKQLLAQLMVQQNQADKIALGMPASVNTFGHSIAAQVIRIDPVVTDGRVMIELDLANDLPTNARPDLSIDGFITVDTIHNARYVEVPSKATEAEPKHIYKVTDQGQALTLAQIEFGQRSDNFIQVISGANAAEQLVISDMSQWKNKQRIKLNN